VGIPWGLGDQRSQRAVPLGVMPQSSSAPTSETVDSWRTPVGSRAFVVFVGVAALLAGILVSLLGLIFIAVVVEPSNGPGEDIGRSAGTALVLVLMALIAPLGLGGGVGGLLLARGGLRWLPRVALVLTGTGLACVALPHEWGAG